MTTSFISLQLFPDLRQRLQAEESRNAAIGPDGDEGVQSAWLREMEREQMRGWLDNPAIERKGPDHPVMNRSAADSVVEHLALNRFQQADGSSGSGRGPVQSRMPEALNRYRNNALGAFETGIDANRVAEGETPAVTERLTAPVERWLMRSKPVANDAGIERTLDESADAEARQGDPASSAENADAAPAPRVSVQWLGNDIKIWIGVGKRDGFSSDDFERLLQESKSLLASEGCQLLSLTCNGEVIYNNSINRES